jgi:hypothetical protein
VVDESTTARYFGRTEMVDGGLGAPLWFPELDRPGEPAADRLDAPGDGKGDCSGADRCELSRMPVGFVECGRGGGSAELAEDTDWSRSRDGKKTMN